MSTHKKIDIICIIVLILAIILTVLFMNGEKLGLTKIVDEDSEEYIASEYFSSNDLNGNWDTEDATIITLDGDSINVSGTGAYVLDGNVYISQSGNYVISGTLTDGSIVVDAEDYSKVWLMLDGVDIYSEDDAAIIVDQADKVFLTLADGSENYLETGDTYSDEALEDNTNGAIFSHDDLTINGSGSLTVTTSYKHGIVSNDDLIITGGTISVTAPKDGLRANDAINIASADITIDVEDDGIHSDGSFYIESGSILINSCYEGIEAITIDMVGGDVTIYSTDDGLNANGGSTDSFGMGGGMPGGMNGGMHGGMHDEMNGEMPADMQEFMSENSSDENIVAIENTSNDETTEEAPSDDSSAESSDESDDESSEESEDEETYINISGGTLTIINDSGNDADGLDSNGDIYISGGTILVSLTNGGSNNAIDYGSESGGECIVTGGTIIAAGSSAMAESFSSSSTQASIMYTYSAGAENNTLVTLEDADGNTILSWEVPNSFSLINLSSPDMTVGNTYTLTIGDTEESITLEDVNTSAGDSASGEMTGGMGMKMGHPGGMGQMNQHSNETDSTSDSESESSTLSEDTEAMPQMTPPAGMDNSREMKGSENTEDTEATTEEVSNLTALSDLDSDVWKLLIASAVVLIGGLTFAYFYRKK